MKRKGDLWQKQEIRWSTMKKTRTVFLQKRREHFNDILRGERSKQAVETELVGIGKTGKRWDANRAKLLEDWELHNKKQELKHE